MGFYLVLERTRQMWRERGRERERGKEGRCLAGGVGEDLSEAFAHLLAHSGCFLPLQTRVDRLCWIFSSLPQAPSQPAALSPGLASHRPAPPLCSLSSSRAVSMATKRRALAWVRPGTGGSGGWGVGSTSSGLLTPSLGRIPPLSFPEKLPETENP